MITASSSGGRDTRVTTEAHRQRQEAAPRPGMLLHQDGSCHEWVPGQKWRCCNSLTGAS